MTDDQWLTHELADPDSPPPPYPCDECGSGIAPRWSPGRHPRHPDYRRWARPDPDHEGRRLCASCRTAERQREDLQRMQRQLEAWGVPARHRGRRYHEHEAQAGRAPRELMTACRRSGRLGVLDHLAPVAAAVEGYDWTTGRGLLLTGPVGTGKSTYAASVLYRARDARALWWGEEALQQAAYLHRMGSGDGPVARARRVPLLVLDDLGTARPTEHWLATVCGLLAARWEERRATVITSNLTPRAIGERYGERTRSRLVDMCDVWMMDGPDWRTR
jgi:DNA replication protein DnaC